MMKFPHLTLHLSSINLVNFCFKTCCFPRLKADVSQADNLRSQVIHTLLMHFLCLFSYTNVCKCHNLQLRAKKCTCTKVTKTPVYRKTLDNNACKELQYIHAQQTHRLLQTN